MEFRDYPIELGMLVTTLHFIRNGDPDEILRIFRKGPDSFKCVFQPGDVRASFSFYLDRESLREYVLGTISMVAEDDMDPYEEVQVSTMIHPRIIFHVSDLSKEEVSDRMWDMIVFSWNQSIVKNELSTNQRNTTNANSERVQNSQRYFSGLNPEDSDS